MNATVFVRREVNSLGAGDRTLELYSEAVKAMQARPASDPTSWAFQAAIHGTLSQHPHPGQNQCQHATWYFVPWHRMFLYYFERIARAAVVQAGGPRDWALPYWNYELAGSSAIPHAFRSATVNGRSNPLFVRERAPGINAGSTLPSAVTSSRFAIRRPSFAGAAEFGGGRTAVMFQQFQGPTGRLEQGPHNDVHNAVGGQGWMGDPDTAAKDPIFWLHHSNIDRLWMQWIRDGHGNPTDPAWASQSFSFFDEHRAHVTLTPSQVLDTVADLGYTYDLFTGPAPMPTPPTPPFEPPATPLSARFSESLQRDPELVGALTNPLRLSGVTERVELALDRRAVAAVAPDPAASAPRVLLQIHEIEAEETPETIYGVYVNLPPEAAEEQEPAHHVGNLSFFGIRRAVEPRNDEHGHGLDLMFDISELATEERADGTWDDASVTVTFKPLPLVAPPDQPAPPIDEQPVTVGGVSVYYA